MSKLPLVGLLMLTYHISVGQTLMVEKAYTLFKDNELKKSWEAINLATEHEQTAQDPRAWYVRSYVSKALYEADQDANKQYAQEGLTAARTCIQLDKKKKYDKECQSVASYIYTSFYNQAVTHLNAGEYQQAIQELQILQQHREEINEFYAESFYLSGYAFLMQQSVDSAEQHFTKALTSGYRDPLIYETLANKYLREKELSRARAMLDMGHILESDNRGLNVTELNILMQEANYTQAMKVAKDYLSSYSDDTEVMQLLGTIYGKLMEKDSKNKKKHLQSRMAIYEKILSIQPNNALANYNLGISYYNQGVDLINDESVFEKDIVEFDKLLDQSVTLFKQALPYMLNANQRDPNNVNTLKALAGIYYSLNNEAKFAQTQDQLSALSQ